MRILFLSGWYPDPPDNGARLRVYHLIRQLAERHEITLLSFLRTGRSRPADSPLDACCWAVETVPLREFQPTRVPALLGLFAPYPRSVVDTHSPQMAALIHHYLGKHPFDLLLASEIGPATGTSAYITGDEGIPCVIEDLELSMAYSEIEAQRTRVGRWRRQLTWWKLQRYIRRLLRWVGGCTVASESEGVLVRRVAPDGLPLVVVPNGVDLETDSGGFGAPKPDTLIYTGALTYSANFDATEFFLRDVFPLVKSQRPNAKLRITGGYDGVPLERLPLGDGVDLTGYLDDIRPAVARSWVSVAPLRVGGGTRLKILEAMALGTPVVSTGKGAEGLEVTPGEDILIADGPAEFADAVLRLLSEDALRARLAANGRRLVEERYTWKASAQKLEQLLAHVAEQGLMRSG